METAQFTLWGSQCQQMIAHCIATSGILTPYLEHGQILFKGSSTVSCLSKLVTGDTLRICGRWTKNGMKGALHKCKGAHFMLYRQGKAQKVDDCLEQTMKGLGPETLFITGANALDAFGHAALLIGSPSGGGYGICMPYLYTEGIQTLILSSVLKLIPGDLTQIMGHVSMRRCGFSYGMACSLAPISGEIITEIEAIQFFAKVQAQIFAKGGFFGAQDSTAIQIQGERDQVERVLTLVEYINTLPEEPPVDHDSLDECNFPCSECGSHHSCGYSGRQNIFHKIGGKE